MAKQLNVNLAFTADTSKAKAQLQDLQNQLTKVINTTAMSTNGLGLDKSLASSIHRATELKSILQSSTTNLGTLDLGLFNENLRKSGISIKQYANTLHALGSEGTQAFSQLAQSIAMAEIPLRKSHTLLHELGTTLKNTARWQISSSILHGFMGAIQSAYGYAQDLNESLNNIRIVTGYNVDQMSRFADEANKAAKTLSTTTTSYTNASLIYYQQGLSDQEVKDRTDITIKMANVARESAETVSDQMTAVWNNFYDGSKSLEYYADVMTALGAATASSTSEISEGLEKFAAVADTVGLSYEYATAALATVTATTRQSADVVGTAFKTLFARIQDLELGETLDDGTTLGKYSEALNAVGINILDASGNLMEMDDILDAMAGKWDTLTKAQQTSLAQTVAGTRQYTQLVALMENWDFMQENLDTVAGSSGTLQEQQDIYAESWEAASKRVKAAAEGIWDELLDDEFFIKLTDGFGKVVEQINNLIDSLGGVKGVLSVLGALMFKVWGKDMVASLERFAYNIKITSQAGRDSIINLRKKTNEALGSLTSDGTFAGGIATDTIKQKASLQDQILDKTLRIQSVNKELTAEEQKQIQNIIQITNSLGDEVVKSSQLVENSLNRANNLKDELNLMIQSSNISKEQQNYLKDILNHSMEQVQIYSTLKPIFSELARTAKNIKIGAEGENELIAFQEKVKQTESSMKALGLTFSDMADKAKNVGITINAVKLEKLFETVKTGSPEAAKKALEEINQILDKIGVSANTNLTTLKTKLLEANPSQVQKINATFNQLETELKNAGQASADTIIKFKNLGVTIDAFGKIIDGFNGKTYSAADGMVAMGSMLMSLSMAINSIKGLSDIWSNEDLSTGEKLLNTFTSLAMVLSMVVSSFTAINIQKIKGIPASIATALTEKAIALEYMKENGHLTAQIVLKTILNSLDLKKIAIYAAIAAAVGLVVWAISAWNAEQEKEIKAAEAAAEKVERLTEKYNELTQAVENFNKVQSEYEEAVKGLEELEKGTKEYSQALEEANKKARELIENYDLYDDYTYDNGVITFDDGVLNQIKAEMQSKADFAEMQKYSAEIYNNEAQLNLKNKELREDIGSKVEYTYTVTGQRQGHSYSYDQTAKRQATDEEMVELANAIDDVTQKSGGVTLSSEKLITALEENAKTLGLSTDLENNLNNIINDETITSIYSYIDSINKADEANRYYAEQILKYQFENEYGATLRELAVDEEGNFDQTLYDELSQIFIQNQDELIEANENLSKKLNENLYLSKWDSGKGTEEYIASVLEEQGMGELSEYYDEIFKDRTYDGDINTQEMLEDYFKAQGFDNVKVKGGNNKNTVTYKTTDEQGNIIEEQLTYSNTEATELWAQEIIDYIIAKSLNEKIKEKIGNDQQVENLTKKLVQASSAYGVNWGQIGREAILNEEFDLSNVFKDLSPSEYEDLLGMTDEQKLALFGLTSEDIKSLTGKSVSEFFYSFNESLKNWTEKDYISQTMSDYENKAEELDIDLDEFKAYRNLLKETNEEYRDNVEGLNQVALANKRMEKGVKTLADDWEDLDDIMSDETSTLEDISSVLPDINSGLKDILNFSDEQFELLPADFAKNNWNTIQDVINGVEGSVENLRNIAGQEILMTIKGVVDPEGNLTQEFADIHDAINNLDDSQFEVGVAIDKTAESEFYNTCQSLINAAGMTADQAQAYFGAMGYNVEFSDNPQKVQQQVVDLEYVYDYDDNGEPIYRHVTPIVRTVDVTMDVPTIKTITPNGTYGGGLGVNTTAPSSPTSGASGDTSPAKKVDRTKKTDIVERYKEIEDSIDDLNNTLEDINEQADRLYGASRLAQMKKANEIIEDEIDALKEKKRQAQDYLAIDRDALGQAAANAGVVLQFDEKGNITNYTQQLSALYDELAAAEAYMDSAFSTSEDQDEYQESTVQPIQDKIDELTDAISQYEETRELLEDLDDEIEEKFYEWQDRNYEMLTYEIEFKLEINEAELKKIDYYLSKYENDAYSQAEAITELSKKKELYLSDLAQENYRYEELNKKYAAGEISQADYAEGMKTVAENTWENLEALRAYDEEMMNFYGDTLAKANEEVTKYADNMGHLASVLDHIKNITSLAGREQDYDLMESIIGNSIEMSENDLAVNKKMYDMYTDEVAKWENELANATAEAEKEAIQKNLDAALKSQQEYEEKMLTSAEDALKKYTELYENNLARISYEFEKLATGGDNFDILQNKMNSLSEHADEFLTDTNKIYETEKMIRSIDKEIGSTSNSVAQQKLKAFRQQTQELQNQGELSQFELDIQQAKYDLLLAEIALEESRNSKTTMRLARDAIGNYSYVYTADAEKVADAEQKVSDAQNKLYNTRLNGANKYGEQLASIRQQWVEAVEGLDRNDKDYYEKRDALNEYYTQKMRDASHLYAIATGEDASIAAESWISSTLVQLGSMEDFTSDMATHLSNMDQEWNTYQENIDSVTESVGIDLNDIEQKVKDLTDKHENLKDKLIDEVIPALDNEITKVGEVSAAWATLRQGLIDTITEYENLGNAAVDAYEKIASVSDTSGEGENPKDNTNLSGTAGDQPTSQGKGDEDGDRETPPLTPKTPPEDPETPLEDPKTETKKYYIEDIRQGTKGIGYKVDGKWYKYEDLDTQIPEIKLATGSEVLGIKEGAKEFKLCSLTLGNFSFDAKNSNIIRTYDCDGKQGSKEFLSNEGLKVLKTLKVIGYRKLEDGTNLYRLSDQFQDPIWPTRTCWLNQTDFNQLLKAEASRKIYEKYNLPFYDTGGYTGQWGPSGKLAVLHEKELVLNKQDTENLLKVIDIIRANKLIDAQVAQLQHDYTTALLEHELTKMSALFDEFMECQEEAPKEVNIYADFPGVSSAVEIEAALRNLANDAAQYSGINWN